MKNCFYLTLPSNSSLADFPNNSSNNIKVTAKTIMIRGKLESSAGQYLGPRPPKCISYVVNEQFTFGLHDVVQC